MLYEQDTIAAIATAQGLGGIGIIRISGKDAVGVTDGIFHAKTPVRDMKSHTIQYGKIVDSKTGTVLDEVMLTKMLAPSTYTREDVIEINCHGSVVAQQEILSLLYKKGARPAEPGEFTKRAFLNGRIDLTQAEAVMDIIAAKTRQSHDAALSQLSGHISKYLNELIDRLLTVIARVEVTVDYPEHDDEHPTSVIATEELTDIYNQLDKALRSYRTGRLLKKGIQTAIVGRPNVGKSTLLNTLAGYDRAIVTDIPGTTRDIIEEEINVDGVLLNVMDTAGIRQTADVVEQIGVERAINSVKDADLVLYVLSLAEDAPVDEGLLDALKTKKVIVILNKEDLASETKKEEVKAQLLQHGLQQENCQVITTSLKEETGVAEIKQAVKDLFFRGKLETNSEILITAERHAHLMTQSMESLQSALDAMNMGMPLDMISIDIRNAAEYLGEIMGTNISEDLVDRVFSTFCLGK